MSMALVFIEILHKGRIFGAISLSIFIIWFAHVGAIATTSSNFE